MSEQSLKDKTVKGTIWSAADAFLGQGVTFIVGLVLARLLSPSEYGLIGICAIFTSVLTGIVDSGFSNALIRKKDTTNEDYNTMFFTNMIISLLLYFFLYISSPWISEFFQRLELVGLIRVMGLILIIQALSITQVTILTKRLDFKTKTKASFVSSFISGVIGIGMALAGCGVWSLVAQQISRQFLNTICLWILNNWRPQMKYNLQSFHYMWNFGWKLMLSGIIDNTWNQLYQVVVGKCYSPATLGQYARSTEYAGLFSSNFTSIIQRVTYPALSKVQDDKERMILAYRKVIKITMFVSSVCMIYMAAIAEPLLYCMIGPQWQQAATFLPFICLSMSFYPLHAINLSMLQVQGRSDLFLILEIIKKTIAIGPLLLGVFWNIYAMLIGGVIVGIISFFLNSYYTGKRLNYTSWMQLKDISPSYGLAFVIAFSVYFLKFLPISNWGILLLQLIIGLMVFVVVSRVTRNEEYNELKSIVISLMLKIKLLKSNENNRW